MGERNIMYICLCHGLTTNNILEAVDKGKKKPTKVHSYYNCKPQCGKCLEFIDKIIDSEKGNATLSL